MSKAEFASHRGVGKSAVSNWAAKGLLVMVDGKVDAAATDAVLAQKLDMGRGRPRGGELPLAKPATAEAADVISLDRERREYVREQKIGLRAKNLREAGELVAKAEAEQALAEMGRVARERMHAVVRRLCERLAAEDDARAIRVLLDDEIDAAFASLADDLEAEAVAEMEADAALAAAEAEEDEETAEDEAAA